MQLVIFLTTFNTPCMYRKIRCDVRQRKILKNFRGTEHSSNIFAMRKPMYREYFRKFRCPPSPPDPPFSRARHPFLHFVCVARASSSEQKAFGSVSAGGYNGDADVDHCSQFGGGKFGSATKDATVLSFGGHISHCMERLRRHSESVLPISNWI